MATRRGSNVCSNESSPVEPLAPGNAGLRPAVFSGSLAPRAGAKTFGFSPMKPPEFCNVDLEIESKSALDPLADELGDRVTVMFSGRMNGSHCLFVEISAPYKSLDGTIHGLCALIEGLSFDTKRLWSGARRKDFDLGFEAQFASDLANQFKIRPSTLSRVAALGAGLAVTFYRGREAEPDAPPNRRPARQRTIRALGTGGGRRARR